MSQICSSVKTLVATGVWPLAASDGHIAGLVAGGAARRLNLLGQQVDLGLGLATFETAQEVPDAHEESVVVPEEFISGTNSLGCTETGTITPDVSGKNFYRVVLTIGPDAACGAYAGQTATGVLAVAGTDMLVGGVVRGNLGDAFLLTRAMPPV